MSFVVLAVVACLGLVAADDSYPSLDSYRTPEPHFKPYGHSYQQSYQPSYGSSYHSYSSSYQPAYPVHSQYHGYSSNYKCADCGHKEEYKPVPVAVPVSHDCHQQQQHPPCPAPHAEVKPVVIQQYAPQPYTFGLPLTPKVIEHHSEPLAINYYGQPYVIKHHQSAVLHAYTQKPVVADYYEHPTVHEAPGPSAVVVEQVCAPGDYHSSYSPKSLDYSSYSPKSLDYSSDYVPNNYYY